MPKPAFVLELSILVIAAMRHAAYAARDSDAEEMTEALQSAVLLYQQHPSHIHAERTHFENLLVMIGAGRRLCERIGRSDADLVALERRAQALRKLLH